MHGETFKILCGNLKKRTGRTRKSVEWSSPIYQMDLSQLIKIRKVGNKQNIFCLGCYIGLKLAAYF